MRVLRNDTEIPIKAPKQRTVLALLLSRANQVVSIDRLIQELWDEEPPTSGKQTLQSLVSRVKRSLEYGGDSTPRAVIGHPNGYELVLPDATCFDMLAFDDAVTRIRARSSMGYDQDVTAWMDRALGLWRGAPFGDVPATPVISAEATRLEEARLQLLEMRADIRLACNAYEEIVVGHRALLAEHSLRERLWGQLMLALYHTGRRTEALKAYSEVRELLAREIGVEPGGELRRLHRQMLDSAVPPPEPGTTSDPRPAALTAISRASAVLPRQLPPDLAHFIGRREELAGARDLLRHARTRKRGTVIAVSGMAGIGKTMFALHLAHQVRHRFSDGQLFVDLHTSESRPLDPGEVLLRLLRSAYSRYCPVNACRLRRVPIAAARCSVRQRRSISRELVDP
ncbi:BTAD domain-containing putative transcriptional regulator [Nonomuraea sp. NPDC052116]|uniref:AfsR/SARP family transcriptional regulator n=1 Tax=Nonomuraea sp. NPDC052116 TaxID=3155665 RepID=UPI003412BD5F